MLSKPFCTSLTGEGLLLSAIYFLDQRLQLRRIKTAFLPIMLLLHIYSYIYFSQVISGSVLYTIFYLLDFITCINFVLTDLYIPASIFDYCLSNSECIKSKVF